MSREVLRRSYIEPRRIPPHVLILRPVRVIQKVVRKLRKINPWPTVGGVTLSFAVLFLIAAGYGRW